MNRQIALCASVLLAAFGCESESTPLTDPTLPASATAGASAPVAPAAPGTPATNGGAPVATAPGAGLPSSPPSSQPPAAAGGDTATPPPAAPTAETGANGARYPDACSERRGSWSKPCTSNPDPCNLKSGYPGDEYCLLPPPEGKGIQVHFGPKSYTDKAEVDKYILNAGEEFNTYAIVNINTTEEKFYSYLKVSMRPGSHHLINNLIEGHPEEGFIEGGGCDGTQSGSFPGTQNLIVESPPQGIPAPENEGLGRTLPPNSSICQNYHRYNVTDEAHLSEIWYNIWYVDESEVTQKTSGVNINAGPWQGIAPGEKITLTSSADITADGRIISLFGHRHAATERFTAWLNDRIVYDSWDWVESRLFNYDSITENPPVDEAGMKDGAVSGVLPFKAGDKVKIECRVNNTTDQTLTFANELYTGEMCILFGATVGPGISRMF